MKSNTVVRAFLVGSIVSLAMLSPVGLSATAQEAAPPAPGGAPPGGGRGGAGGQGGGQAPNPDAFVDRMMQNDANGDGKLSRDEVPGNFADRLFEGGDADKDGFLTRDELKAVAATLPGGGGGGRGGAGGPGGRGQGGPGGAVGAGGQEISFGAHMNQAGRAMRALSRSTFDASSRDSDLNAVGSVQAALVGAKSRSATVPMAAHLKEKYGTDENGYRGDLRKGLIKAIAAALELEMAVLDGDSAAAKAALAKLDETQESGHLAFQEAEDERPAPRGGGRGGDGAPGGAGSGGAGGAGGGGN